MGVQWWEPKPGPWRGFVGSMRLEGDESPEGVLSPMILFWRDQQEVIADNLKSPRTTPLAEMSKL